MSKREKKATIWWSVKTPWRPHDMFPFHTASRRKDAIEMYLECYPKDRRETWKQLYAKGYRCVRVKIVEIA